MTQRNRNSRWTMIYSDANKQKLFYYVRLVPDCLDLEAAGFPHGISVTGNEFDTWEDASKMADKIDKFMDCMEKEIKGA